MSSKKTITLVEKELPVFVKELLVALPRFDCATVLALSGDLGAGKTTFVKSLATQLGVREPVTSPTFTILKSYETADSDFGELLHMDAYRIETAAELGPLHFMELLKRPKTIFCIEWAEKITESLPENTIWLHFTCTTNEAERTIQFELP